MCLNTGSSVLVDCKFGFWSSEVLEAVDEGNLEGRLQRISSRINHIYWREPRKDLCRGSAAGLTTSTEEDQGRIFVRKDHQQDQPDQPHHRRKNSGQIIHVDSGSRASSSSEEQRTKFIHVDPEDDGDLHRQRSDADVFYIHRYQAVAFHVITISPRCNLGLFQSVVGSVWVCLNTGSPVMADCKFGSEAVDKGDSEVVCRGSAAGSTT